MLVGTKKDLIAQCKKNKSVVLEVTTKQLYIIPEGLGGLSIEDLKKEWFEDFENRSHVFKDNCLVGNSNEVIKVEEIYE